MTWERFTLDVSILYLAMIIVGGLGSIAGAVYGAIFMGLLPPLLTELVDLLSGTLPVLADQLPAIRNAVFGLAIIIVPDLRATRARPHLEPPEGLHPLLALPLLSADTTGPLAPGEPTRRPSPAAYDPRKRQQAAPRHLGDR